MLSRDKLIIDSPGTDRLVSIGLTGDTTIVLMESYLREKGSRNRRRGRETATLTRGENSLSI